LVLAVSRNLSLISAMVVQLSAPRIEQKEEKFVGEEIKIDQETTKNETVTVVYGWSNGHNNPKLWF
jgi:hypothetical protein